MRRVRVRVEETLVLLRCLRLKNLVKSEFVTLWPWVYLSVPAWCAVLLWSNVNTSLLPHPTLPRKILKGCLFFSGKGILPEDLGVPCAIFF